MKENLNYPPYGRITDLLPDENPYQSKYEGEQFAYYKDEYGVHLDNVGYKGSDYQGCEFVKESWSYMEIMQYVNENGYYPQINVSSENVFGIVVYVKTESFEKGNFHLKGYALRSPRKGETGESKWCTYTQEGFIKFNTYQEALEEALFFCLNELQDN